MDDVEKVAKYIVLIVPGFLVLAICDYMIEWSTLEPHVFVPAAVVFSIFIYAISFYTIVFATGLYWCFWRSGETRPVQAPMHLPSFILVALALSVIVGGGFSLLYLNNSFVWVIRQFDSRFDTIGFSTKKDPLQHVVSKVSASQADVIDGRPIAKQPTAMLRLPLDDGGFIEGYPMYYPRSGESYVYLSFACYIAAPDKEPSGPKPASAANSGEGEKEKRKARSSVPPLAAKAKYSLVEGPGILVQIKDLPTIEVVDYKASPCRALHCQGVKGQGPPCN